MHVLKTMNLETDPGLHPVKYNHIVSGSCIEVN